MALVLGLETALGNRLIREVEWCWYSIVKVQLDHVAVLDLIDKVKLVQFGSSVAQEGKGRPPEA